MSTEQTYGQTTPPPTVVDSTVGNLTPTAQNAPQTESSRLVEMLTISGDVSTYRLMLRSWFLSYLLEKEDPCSTLHHTGPVYENAFLYEAMDEFVRYYELLNAEER